MQSPGIELLFSNWMSQTLISCHYQLNLLSEKLCWLWYVTGFSLL